MNKPFSFDLIINFLFIYFFFQIYPPALLIKGSFCCSYRNWCFCPLARFCSHFLYFPALLQSLLSFCNLHTPSYLLSSTILPDSLPSHKTFFSTHPYLLPACLLYFSCSSNPLSTSYLLSCIPTLIFILMTHLNLLHTPCIFFLKLLVFFPVLPSILSYLFTDILQSLLFSQFTLLLATFLHQPASSFRY